MSNSSIWPIDRILSGATTPDQSGLWSDDNKEILHIPGASPLDGLMSYSGHSLGEWGSYLSTEMQ